MSPKWPHPGRQHSSLCIEMALTCLDEFHERPRLNTSQGPGVSDFTMTKKATGNPIDSPRGSRGSRTPGPGTPGPFRLSPSRCATAPRGMPKQFSDLFRASPPCVSFGNYVLRCAADAAKQRAGGFDLHHNEKSDRIIPIALFVGAEGVEPPTLCL